MGSEYPRMTLPEPRELLPTRRSLLSKLRNFDDQDSWREFFDTYWRLIYGVARKSGLDDSAAQDVVQETMISAAAELPGFRYDPAHGSFKGWLLRITRCRIADQLRKQYRAGQAVTVSAGDSTVERLAADPGAATAASDELWEDEWRTHLLETAVDRVKHRVRADHFQIFELHALRGMSAAGVAKALGVSQVKVYVTRHRVAAQVRKEVQRLERQSI